MKLEKFSPGEKPTLSVNETKARFLEMLEDTASVKEAALAVGIEEEQAWTWRRRDKTFAFAWDRLWDAWLPRLESVAIQKALNGESNMLIFMLKSMNRKRYDDAVARAESGTSAILLKIKDVQGKLGEK